MNLLLATGIFPPDIGGPATYVAGLAPELCQRGLASRWSPMERCLPTRSCFRWPASPGIKACHNATGRISCRCGKRSHEPTLPTFKIR